MNQNNKYLAVDYKLYVDGDNKRDLVEETRVGQPFTFITGFGYALEAFEQQLADLEEGSKFQFAIPKEQAYGDYDDERVLELGRDVFSVDGKFDGEHVYPNAIIPMQNEEGQRFFGRVLEVGPQQVKIDLNHPLAGQTLYFEGTVLVNRLATDEEIKRLVKHLACGCEGDCEGGCGGGGCEGGCGGGCGK